jgi:hypothetical protein
MKRWISSSIAVIDLSAENETVMRPSVQRSFRNSGRRRAPTVADLVTIGLLLALSIVAAGVLQRGAPAGVALVRTADGEFVLPLDIDVVRDCNGPQGVTRLTVQRGSISVTQAPCRLQLCRRMGKTSSASRSLVCIPNRISVRILATDDAEAIDALAR